MNSVYIKKAIENLENAYAPYSNFNVSALLLTKDNKEYYGVNVENASYGATICAERSAIVSFIADGGKANNIKSIFIVAKLDRPVPPCSICRQVMIEFFDKNVEIVMANTFGDVKVTTIDELVPYSFSKGDLNGKI